MHGEKRRLVEPGPRRSGTRTTCIGGDGLASFQGRKPLKQNGSDSHKSSMSFGINSVGWIGLVASRQQGTLRVWTPRANRNHRKPLDSLWQVE